MQRTTILHVAREGWPILGLTFAAGFYLYTFHGILVALPLLAVAIYLIAFFHEPDRVVPSEPLAIIAPVDGRVIHRRECYDHFLDREAIRLSIRVAHLGAYMIRSPSEGMILEIPSDAWPEFTGTATWIRTDEEDDVIFAVSEGTLFGKRPCLSRYGERVGQGRRCGARRWARQIDVYLPPNCRVEVEVGQNVRAGRDVLATLMRKNGTAVK